MTVKREIQAVGLLKNPALRPKVVMFIAESIRTMPATLLATVSTPQEITGSKDH